MKHIQELLSKRGIMIFDMISTFNSQGNFDHNYILEN